MKPAFKTTKIIDQSATCAMARKARLDAGLMLTQIAAEMPDTSLSMLYLMERGKRKWTEEVFGQFMETIERLKK